MSELTPIIAILQALIGVFVAVLSGFLKNKWSKDPENFNPDKLLRTLLIGVVYTFIKMFAQSYGFDFNVDIFVGGIVDSGLIAILERFLLALWRKAVGTGS